MKIARSNVIRMEQAGRARVDWPEPAEPPTPSPVVQPEPVPAEPSFAEVMSVLGQQLGTLSEMVTRLQPPPPEPEPEPEPPPAPHAYSLVVRRDEAGRMVGVQGLSATGPAYSFEVVRDNNGRIAMVEVKPGSETVEGSAQDD